MVLIMLLKTIELASITHRFKSNRKYIKIFENDVKTTWHVITDQHTKNWLTACLKRLGQLKKIKAMNKILLFSIR